MAVHLNLLNEQQTARVQRQRDPLKIGMLAVLVIIGILALFYFMRQREHSRLVREVGAARTEFEQKAPLAEEARLREQSLSASIRSSDALMARARTRLLWGPVLENLLKTLPRETQINRLDGNVTPDDRRVDLALEGLSAGSEPRKVAEETRRALLENFSRNYRNVTINFKSLEDDPITVTLDGQKWPTARFILHLSFEHPRVAGIAPPASPTPPRRAKKGGR